MGTDLWQCTLMAIYSAAPLEDQMTGRYRTHSNYSNTETASPYPILLVLSAQLEGSEYQLLSNCFDSGSIMNTYLNCQKQIFFTDGTCLWPFFLSTSILYLCRVYIDIELCVHSTSKMIEIEWTWCFDKLISSICVEIFWTLKWRQLVTGTVLTKLIHTTTLFTERYY